MSALFVFASIDVAGYGYSDDKKNRARGLVGNAPTKMQIGQPHSKVQGQ